MHIICTATRFLTGELLYPQDSRGPSSGSFRSCKRMRQVGSLSQDHMLAHAYLAQLRLPYPVRRSLIPPALMYALAQIRAWLQLVRQQSAAHHACHMFVLLVRSGRLPKGVVAWWNPANADHLMRSWQITARHYESRLVRKISIIQHCAESP